MAYWTKKREPPTSNYVSGPFRHVYEDIRMAINLIITTLAQEVSFTPSFRDLMSPTHPHIHIKQLHINRKVVDGQYRNRNETSIDELAL